MSKYTTLLFLLLLLLACGPLPDSTKRLTNQQFRTRCTGTVLQHRAEFVVIPASYKLYATNVLTDPLPMYSRYVGVAFANNLVSAGMVSQTQLDVYFGDCTELKEDGSFGSFIQNKSSVVDLDKFKTGYFPIN
jgi:hypothetical protein